MGERSDINLAGRAIAQGWPIPEESRGKLVAQMLGVIENSSSPRAKIAAMRTVLAMTRQNLDGLKVETGVQRLATVDGAPAEIVYSNAQSIRCAVYARVGNAPLAEWVAAQQEDDLDHPSAYYTDERVEEWIHYAITHPPVSLSHIATLQAVSMAGDQLAERWADRAPTVRVPWDGLDDQKGKGEGTECD